ncbi:hypothetical protein JKP88DRAFT_310920 [Tribonema minus]|uniref:Amino acid transporter transmembrane domain-containing protein n=1 Tax=Tribonema minus TaxID=303371 RepID=A0A835Z2K9_9STRA|nr:hypothetical protein JKP88DRAFT_310920 [Tribonema minus]
MIASTRGMARAVLALLALGAATADAFAAVPSGRQLHRGRRELQQRGQAPQQQGRALALATCRMSGGSAGGGEASAATEADKSTMTQSVFNLVKNIMEAMTHAHHATHCVHRARRRRHAVAAGGRRRVLRDARGAIAPAGAIIAALGALSAYTFSLIGRSCAQTKAESYEQAWSRAVSPRSAALPAGACVATCFAGCLAYTLIIGDTFSALARTAGAPARVAARSTVIGVLSAGVLLPLSLLRNLSALGFTSMLGTGGLLYTAGMMGLRVLTNTLFVAAAAALMRRYFDGSYAPSGRFFNLLPAAAQPVFGMKKANPLLFLVLPVFDLNKVNPLLFLFVLLVCCASSCVVACVRVRPRQMYAGLQDETLSKANPLLIRVPQGIAAAKLAMVNSG